jgi:hypothetical protein
MLRNSNRFRHIRKQQLEKEDFELQEVFPKTPCASTTQKIFQQTNYKSNYDFLCQIMHGSIDSKRYSDSLFLKCKKAMVYIWWEGAQENP